MQRSPNQEIEKCPKCKLGISKRQKSIACSKRESQYHLKCDNVSDDIYELCRNKRVLWCCPNCHIVSQERNPKGNCEMEKVPKESKQTDQRTEKDLAEMLAGLMDMKLSKWEEKIGSTIEGKILEWEKKN